MCAREPQNPGCAEGLGVGACAAAARLFFRFASRSWRCLMITSGGISMEVLIFLFFGVKLFVGTALWAGFGFLWMKHLSNIKI